MAKKTRKKRTVSRRKPSKAVAFRLPADVIELASVAALAQHVSRNKLVELTLRKGLADYRGVTREPEAPAQPDLFS